MHERAEPQWEEDIRESQGSSEENLWGINSSEENLARRFMGSLQITPMRRKVIHDVLPFKLDRKGREYVDQCVSMHFGGGLFIVAEHGDHIHLVHDCTNPTGHCRCNRVNFLRSKGRKLRRKVEWSTSFPIGRIINLVKYLDTRGRKINELQVGYKRWIINGKTGIVSMEGCQGITSEGLVEEGFIACKSVATVGENSSSSRDRQTGGHSDGTSGSGSQCGKASYAEKLMAFILNIIVSPLSYLVHTTNWTDSSFFWQSRKKDVLDLCQFKKGLRINKMSVEEIERDLNVLGRHLYFAARDYEVDTYYYNIEDSIKYLIKMLIWQCGDENRAKLFMQNLFDIVDKRIPKKNCLMIIGPPNSGKNWFFDHVIHFFQNFGQIGNFNKFVSFPLQESVNKRILLWNEPNCEPSAFDTCKMLFGGDLISVRVKYQQDAVVARTPIIVLSNVSVFPTDKTFQTRMSTWYWKVSPWLKECNKKPTPLAFPKLLRYFNIIENKHDMEDTDDNTDEDKEIERYNDNEIITYDIDKFRPTPQSIMYISDEEEWEKCFENK